MTSPSPLIAIHRQADASLISYADAADLVETFGQLELEYAAIRKSAAILDLPQLAHIRVRGDDRLEFLSRMLTQNIESLAYWSTARSFLTTRQGRIVADLTLIHTPHNTLLLTDILAADTAIQTLEQFLFAEDVTLENAAPDLHTLAIHGPTARDLLAHLASPDPDAADDPPPITNLQHGRATRLLIAGKPVLIHRHDTTGEPGYVLTVATADAAPVYSAITEAGVPPEHDHVEAKAKGETHPFRLRPIGWHAYNIARIEAGTPLFNIDFAPNNLPAETGVLHDRVSFTKGCYPGQEVVARMHNLGHPRQILTALRVTPPPSGAGPAPGPPTDSAPTPDFQPLTGAALLEPGAPEESKPLGAVTSSTRSPMLSDAIICFAQLKWDATDPKTTLDVLTPAGRATATVQPTLCFWRDD